MATEKFVVLKRIRSAANSPSGDPITPVGTIVDIDPDDPITKRWLRHGVVVSKAQHDADEKAKAERDAEREAEIARAAEEEAKAAYEKAKRLNEAKKEEDRARAEATVARRKAEEAAAKGSTSKGSK